jgi:hypothetical protein
MRRKIVAALLVVAFLPGVVFAAEDVFNNERGTISISSSGIASKGSQLVYCGGIVPPAGHSLGPVRFSTGALTSGTLTGGGTFSSVGSSFIVIGIGDYGEPKGTIFEGSFHGKVHWTLISQKGDKLVFELHGAVTGTLYNGRMVGLSTHQKIITTKEQLAQGIGHIASGKTVAYP